MTTIVVPTVAHVLDEVDAYVRENRHSDRSFVRDVLAGNTNREGLGRWAVQKFHQVYEQNRVFSAIHSVATSEALRQFMIEQLIAEETDIRDGSAPHYVLMRRFGLALGVPSSQFISTLPAPEVMTFVNFLLELARRRPVNCLLAIYINESQSHESASKLFRYLSAEFGLSSDDLEWFSVHGEADVEHAAHGREIIQELADADFIKTAMDTAKEACRQWLNLHQFYADLHAGQSTSMVS